jgi:hypothetical protein
VYFGITSGIFGYSGKMLPTSACPNVIYQYAMIFYFHKDQELILFAAHHLLNADLIIPVMISGRIH